MTPDTFYTPPPLVTPPTLVIEGDELNHLSNVMRVKAGDTIRVVDGGGNAYDAVITEISRTSAICSITARHSLLNEPSREILLGVGILKNPARFDFLVEKTVELGVRTIVPLLTARTIPRPDKVDRWQKLCLSAMKQSGRCVLPSIRAPIAFDGFIAAAPEEARKFIPHEKVGGTTSLGLPDLIMSGGNHRRIVICIGPEGGFTGEEVRQAVAAGFEPVSLGPRRLRTETAAIVTVAALLGE